MLKWKPFAAWLQSKIIILLLAHIVSLIKLSLQNKLCKVIILYTSGAFQICLSKTEKCSYNELLYFTIFNEALNVFSEILINFYSSHSWTRKFKVDFFACGDFSLGISGSISSTTGEAKHLVNIYFENINSENEPNTFQCFSL